MRLPYSFQAALAIFLASFSHSSFAQNAHGPVFPALNLGQGARGAGIIAALGSRLPEVARFYGMTEPELGALCLRDHDLRCDKTGRLLYVCEGTVAQAPTAQNAGTNALLTFPSSQTFLLHSKPGLGRVLYLDCNGHTTSGTSWKSGATFTSPPYDTDGTTASFSSGELANIQEIWKRVSEDYAPWDVDVTTEEPPLESLRKTSSTDTTFGIRMVIGGSSYDWYGAGAGGVAYLGSFSWNSDTPAFVFPAQLGNGWPKYVAEAVSHEAGHTVGLNHDGVSSGTAYYEGHNGWAPIMGVGYYASVTQFSKGEYTSANNTEDDTTIINSHIPRSADLAGNDILTAVPLSGTSVSATGIIENRSDADLYRVNAGSGTLSFNVASASPDADLDISLGLYDGSGNLLASSNPSGLSAALSTSVTGGTYYLAVDGVGSGTASTGYTDYASLGQFSLTGTVPATAGQPPVAVVSQSTPTSGLTPLTVNFSSAGSYDPEGSVLTYDWDFGDGTGSTEANPAHVFSTAGTFTASLVVFDNTGLSGSSSLVFTAQSLSSVIFVSGITMTTTSSSGNRTRAAAVVMIKDAAGNPKPNATVTGKWSGLTSGTSSVQTGAAGTATFTSAWTKNSGTFIFTVNGITLTGATYDPARNVMSSASITK